MFQGFMRIAVLFCVVPIFCAGCFPFHYCEQPGIRGTVVDQQSGLPLTNALVDLAVIYGFRDETNSVDVWKTNSIARTNVNFSGSFEIPPVRKWGIYIIPMDVFPRDYKIRASAVDHVEKDIYFMHCATCTGKNTLVGFGNIPLRPEK
jgi:hypothetical protein